MKSRKIRFVYMIVTGVFIKLLLSTLNFGLDKEHNYLHDTLASILITIAVWEGNLRIDHLMNKWLPWINSPVKRLLIHLPVSLVFSSFVIYMGMLGFNHFVCELPNEAKRAFMAVSLVIGVLISIILMATEISTQFFRQWKSSLVEVERYKNESLQAQLQSLKNQLNPHFLFNNMSVLSSLVCKDQEKAVDFIEQLSKVYRYLLENNNTELVTLDTELKFISSYNYLLQIRFEPNITFDISVPDDARKLLLPPMSLQLLIENCIKHNEVSKEFPLHIKVYVEDELLVVSNNLQLRTTRERSTGTGLKNIEARYKYFTDTPIKIIKEDKKYTVKIALLQEK